jgi:tRNA pseudouridine55 synthase
MTDRSGGLLVVDKPAGWTSHDVVARARRLCGTRRVGHAGTLDPMATGVLVLGVERGTKLLTFLVGCDKSYAATIRLGMATLTDDAEGETTQALGVDDVPALEAALPAAVAALTGEIQQVPSAVSAIKVKGVRSYTRVRQGDTVELPARPVTVSRFDVLSVRPATVTPEVGPAIGVVDVDVEVEVSSGTYVRALARDLGAALGVGGHLTALRRTRVGRFGLEHAVALDELSAASEAQGPAGIRLLPIPAAARAGPTPSRRSTPRAVAWPSSTSPARPRGPRWSSSRPARPSDRRARPREPAHYSGRRAALVRTRRHPGRPRAHRRHPRQLRRGAPRAP